MPPPQPTSVSSPFSSSSSHDAGVGLRVGDPVGAGVGLCDGDPVGGPVGRRDGLAVGRGDGLAVGAAVPPHARESLGHVSAPA